MKANDVRWPTFYGKFVKYTKFKRKWRAYWQTYHAFVGNDSADKPSGRNLSAEKSKR